MSRITISGLCFILLTGTVNSAPTSIKNTVHFSSKNLQSRLLEVYSSQGCSSCPPAQSWINNFENDPGLWRSVVPVVFHVDYWDGLGWNDRFASKAFSQRQQEYKRQGNVNSVYTPGFIFEGREWTGWFNAKKLPQNAPHNIGQLDISVHNSKLEFNYSVDTHDSQRSQLHLLTYNVALLGVGINTRVKSGENAGKNLTESFIVLQHQQGKYIEGQSLNINLQNNHAQAKRFAIAAWVSDRSMTPLQVVGGELPSSFRLN
ncbi:DUF1223 domain-containing protein [Paraglaciecola sp. 20A4]|uniref:DUF1223 domain-containing protein n=1 Tax=Paraglaciecola sp. 20A4 TaxID=2687288 RepID=UPI001408FFAB|nr:DUF1223 domain-containing protein [Paraglaciecola sp. 20A4]